LLFSKAIKYFVCRLLDSNVKTIPRHNYPNRSFLAFLNTFELFIIVVGEFP